MEHKKAACCYFYDTLREKIHFTIQIFVEGINLQMALSMRRAPLYAK